jgi:ABC-2 type transport system permease protein
VHAALVIAAKDLRQKIRDRTAIVMAVIAPFSLAALFALVIPASATSFHTSYVVVDLDGGATATLLRGQVLDRLVQAGIADISTAATEADGRASVDAGTVAAAIVLPAGLTAAVQAGQPAELRVIGSANSSLSVAVARSVLERFASRVDAVQLSVATALAGDGTAPDPATIAQLAARAAAVADPISLDQKLATDRSAGYATFYGASMAILFLFFTTGFGIATLLGERRNGTLSRMLAAPMAPGTIILGKILTSFVLGFVATWVLVAATTLALGARWGSPLPLAAVIAAAVIAATGISVAATTLAKTEDQASTFNSIVAMLLAVLGGTFFPLSQAPEAMATISQITPHAWFLRAIDELAAPGAGFAEIALPVAVLLAMGIVTGGFGIVRSSRLLVR